MSTLTIVQKDGFVAMAADQMTTLGPLKVPAHFKSNASKIIRTGDSFIGIPGYVACIRTMESVVKTYSDRIDLTSCASIFETFRALHTVLVDEYYSLTEEQDEDQPYQSNQLEMIIANETGIYRIDSYRDVGKYTRFWAVGSGSDCALGAMETIYDNPDQSAQVIAERGVEVACMFDSGSGLPLESYTIRLMENGL
ncbi:MAG: MFS transporter [Planctomycetes bacterium]|nr:MFS transporter [Planctomycetota bacterium]